jgi:hypothetical protein
MANDTALVRVLLCNGHVASDGTQGPWTVATVPADEASAIVARRYGRILGPDEDPADLGQTRRHTDGVSN